MGLRAGLTTTTTTAHLPSTPQCPNADCNCPFSVEPQDPPPKRRREPTSAPCLLLLPGTFSQGLLSLLLPRTYSFCHSTPPRPPTNTLYQGTPWKTLPTPHPQAQCYLGLEFPILKEPQLILTFQIVSINVAEVYLKTETESAQTPGSCPTSNSLPVPPAAQRSPDPS